MNLVIIFGPPAVGRMTVGAELSRLTGLSLFHNHLTIELVLPFFPFGSPAFGRLVGEMRNRIVDEVAAGGGPGLIFTYVWALDHADDKAFIDGLAGKFRSRGGRVCYVELAADLDTRLQRNEGESRLAAKPSKHDLPNSRRLLLGAQDKYRLNSSDDFFYPADHLKIDNSRSSPGVVAGRVANHFAIAIASTTEAHGKTS